MELLCSRDLAIKLGALVPDSLEHFKHLRGLGYMRVRDPATGQPMFWPQQISPYAAMRSS